MKTNNLTKMIFALIAAVFLAACVQDDDFTTPSNLGEAENLKLTTLLSDPNYQEVDIDYVKGLFVNGEVTEITSDIYVKGYVVSSDENGNFYKEFYLQDAPSNPTAAIKVAMNVTDIFGKYNFGREVYVNLKGLYVGETNSGDGITAIGGGSDSNLEDLVEITEARANAQVLRSELTETIVGLPVAFSALSSSHIGMYVTVSDAQFENAVVGDPVVNPYDDFDSQRTMESCEGFGYANFILETSTFANFKDMPIPSGGGTISGVISKDYFGDNMVMVLNTYDDISFGNARCTPLDINDFTLLFEGEFTTTTDFNSWENYSVSGSQQWFRDTFNAADPVARMSGYSGGAQTNEDWLISPMVDLSSAANTVFFFESDKRFGGADLEVYYSTDYAGSGDPYLANWTQLAPVLDSNENSWGSWVNSGTLDVSAADGGNLYIAFKYVSDNSNAATWQVDGVKVLSL